jgi:hypothetical protein
MKDAELFNSLLNLVLSDKVVLTVAFTVVVALAFAVVWLLWLGYQNRKKIVVQLLPPKISVEFFAPAKRKR